MRMMEVLSSLLPSSSCSSSSPAASLPPLTTHSWSRARQSCGRGVVPPCLQRREAGRELEVASLGRPGQSPVPHLPLGRTWVHPAPRCRGLGLVPGCPRARAGGKAAGL